MFHHCEHHRDHWASGRHGRRPVRPSRLRQRPAWPPGRGMDGDDDMMRAGRMLAQGDLRLIALALIAEQPRHGYEIIKLLEERTSAGTARAPASSIRRSPTSRRSATSPRRRRAAKKLYTITDEGRGYLEENQELADAVLVASPVSGSARRDGSATAARGATSGHACRSSSGRRSTTCVTLPRSASRAIPRPRPASSRCWPGQRLICNASNRTTATMSFLTGLGWRSPALFLMIAQAAMQLSWRNVVDAAQQLRGRGRARDRPGDRLAAVDPRDPGPARVHRGHVAAADARADARDSRARAAGPRHRADRLLPDADRLLPHHHRDVGRLPLLRGDEPVAGAAMAGQARSAGLARTDRGGRRVRAACGLRHGVRRLPLFLARLPIQRSRSPAA